MRWETVPLGDVVSPVSSRAGARKLPVYSVTKHSGFVPSTDYFKKQVFSQDLSTYKVVEKGQFAYATIHLDEGSIGVAPEACIISPMYTVFSVDQSRVDAGYLIRLMKSPTAVAQYSRLGRGTAERRKSISLEALGRLGVHLPPLPEQRRIAAILDDADDVRQKATGFRRHALEELAATLVIEATSASNTRAPLSRLGVSLSAGLSVGDGGLDSHPDHRVLKVSAVSRGAFDATETKSMPMDYKPPTAHLVRSGDLLMTRASGSLDLIARSAFVTQIHDHVYLPDKIWRVEVSPDSPLSKRFIDGLTRHPAFRSYVENEASGASGVRNISQAKVLSYEAPVPPAASLTALEGQLVMVEEMRESLAVRAETVDELFASLQHRAFRGEL